MSGERFPVRSYKRVYRRDWRIYKIDKWRLPIANGLPLFMVTWALATFVAVLIASRLPLLGDFLGLFYDAWVYLVFPILVGVLMTRVAPDGRTPRRFIMSVVLYHLRAHQRSAGRPITREAGNHATLPVRSDQYRPDLAKARIPGPALVELPEEMVVSDILGNPRRKKARRPKPGRMGDVTRRVELREGETLEISP